MRACETGVRSGIARIQSNSLAEIPQCCAGTAIGAGKHGIIAAKVKLVRRNGARRAALDASEGALAQPQIELTCYRAGNLALNGEDVFQFAIVGFRPASGSVPRIDEPDLDPELRAGFLYPGLDAERHCETDSAT